MLLKITKTGIIFFNLLFFLLLWGCINDVILDEKKVKNEIVLNCFLDTKKDTVSVWLSYSKPIQSNLPFEPVIKANIELFENEKPVGSMFWVDSSLYVLPYKIQPGKTYHIEAETGDKKVWAETTVPGTVNAQIEKVILGAYSNDYRILLNDNKNEKNYYWVSATGFEGASGNQNKNIACYVYSNFEHADDFNQTIYQNGKYKFEYEYYLRFTDNELTNEPTGIVFYPQCIVSPLEVFLLSTDYHLDKYMKSSLLLNNMEILAQEMPILYSPFPMYSNINGGTGIFGSFNSSSKLFDAE
jgi:hypothetical protein